MGDYSPLEERVPDVALIEISGIEEDNIVLFGFDIVDRVLKPSHSSVTVTSDKEYNNQ